MSSETNEKTKTPWYKRKLIVIPLGVIVGLGVVSAIVSPNAEAPEVAATSQPQTQEEEVVAEPEPEPEPELVEVPDVTGIEFSRARAAVESIGLVTDGEFDADFIVIGIEPEAGTEVDPGSTVVLVAEAPEPELSLAQEQAVQSADSYLRNVGGFSRPGLIGQLEFEGFSTKDAEFAVDYISPDWKEQAAQSAESYMENIGGFSRDGLYGQLEFEEFTHDQIEYALKQVGY